LATDIPRAERKEGNLSKIGKVVVVWGFMGNGGSWSWLSQWLRYEKSEKDIVRRCVREVEHRHSRSVFQGLCWL
jgi:hypothetical protein